MKRSSNDRWVYVVIKEWHHAVGKKVWWQVWFTLDINGGGRQRMAGTDEIVMDMQLWLA